MPLRARFRLMYSDETIGHLNVIDRKWHGQIRQAIEEQLVHTPDLQTRNRKPLQVPAELEATWELRCGPGNRFRVFYEMDKARHTVWMLAIGVKVGSRLLIAGEEIQL